MKKAGGGPAGAGEYPILNVAHRTMGCGKGIGERCSPLCSAEVTDVDETPLAGAEAKLFRGVAARLNYLSPDRPDIQYAVKEAARTMANPRACDWGLLKKIGRYLLYWPRLQIRFAWQKRPECMDGYTDSDWAGCTKSRRSTSGAVLMIGHHCIKSSSKQQKVLALSSAEAETYGMVNCSAELLGLQACAEDLGLSYKANVYADASAALGIVMRRGIGKVRHIRTQSLWLQEAHATRRLGFEKIDGSMNPADLMTKHLSDTLLTRHLEQMRAIPMGGRAATAPTLNSLDLHDHDHYFLGSCSGAGALKRGGEVNVQEVKLTGTQLSGQTRRAANGNIISGIESRGIYTKQGIPHTCATGTCLQVRKWGDDEEQDVQRLACVACILGLDRRQQPAGEDSIEGRRCSERRLLRVTFNPNVRIYKVQPYSEVYGAHPRTFNFDKYGNHQSMKIVPSEDCQHLGRGTASGGVRNHAMQIGMADRRLTKAGRAGIVTGGGTEKRAKAQTQRSTQGTATCDQCVDRSTTCSACSVDLLYVRRAAQAVSVRPLYR